MGMNCFFINILPTDAQINFQTENYRGFIYRVRKINCISTCLSKDWISVFNTSGLLIKQFPNSSRPFWIINDCVDFYTELSEEGFQYITLIGSFSCYDTAIATIIDVLKIVALATNDRVKLFANGVVTQYDEIDIEDFLYLQFNEKYEIFKKNVCDYRVIAPSQFGKQKKFRKFFEVLSGKHTDNITK